MAFEPYSYGGRRFDRLEAHRHPGLVIAGLGFVVGALIASFVW